MADPTLLLFILIPGVVIAGIVWAWQLGKKRRAALQAVAAQLGLRYEEPPTEPLVQWFSGLLAINRGHSRRCLNAIVGSYQGLDVRLIDYRYTTGSGKEQATHRAGIAVARLPVRWPNLTIVPETWGHKLWDAIGGDDIDFESDEFSRKFWVKCDDKRFAYDLIHPRSMELLMAPGWTHWQVRDDLVCLWNDRIPRPEDWPAIVERLRGFVELVPAQLRRALEAPA